MYFGEIPKWAFYKEMLKRPAWAEAQGACGGSRGETVRGLEKSWFG